MNVKLLLIIMILITLQCCELPAGLNNDGTAKSAAEITTACDPVDGCPWFPEQKDLEWDGCMQEFVQDFIDEGYKCELRPSKKATGSYAVVCDYPVGTTQDQVDREISARAMRLRARMIEKFGWYKDKYTPEKSLVRVGVYYTDLLEGGLVEEDAIHISVPQPLDIHMRDCSKD